MPRVGTVVVGEGFVQDTNTPTPNKILTYEDYITLSKQNIFRQRVKIELLRPDFSVYSVITGDLISSNGNISVTKKNGLRRTASFSLTNHTTNYVGKYTPNLDLNVLPPRQIFKLWMGLADDEDKSEYYISQGIYVLEDPQITSNLSESIVTINCCDLFGLYDGTVGGEINSTFIIPLGSTIFSVLQSIIQLQGYNFPIIFDNAFNGQTTFYTITKEAGSNLGDVMIELVKMLSGWVYFNINGSLVFEQDYPDNQKPSSFDFSEDEIHFLGNATNTVKYSELYNSVLVIGSNVNGVIYYASTDNVNLLSSTSIQSLGYTRQKLVQDSNIYSNDLCAQRSRYELKLCCALANEITFDAIPIYEIDVNQVITITNSDMSFIKQRFLVNSFTIPLNTGGKMSITATNVNDLLFSN